MTFQMPRLTPGRGRRLLSASLIVLYFWAFVALGLTHTHKLPGAATRRHAAGAAVASGLAQRIVKPAKSEDDAPCPVCTAVYAATVALLQPPVPAHALLPVRHSVVWSPVLIPSRTPRISRSRAPPHA